MIFSDPPLDTTDIPDGQWLCHMCRKLAEESSERQARNKRSNSSSSSQGSSEKPKKAKLNSLEVLVKAASMLNPKQFELPKNLSLPCVFPGTDKGNLEFFFRPSIVMHYTFYELFVIV